MSKPPPGTVIYSPIDFEPRIFLAGQWWPSAEAFDDLKGGEPGFLTAEAYAELVKIEREKDWKLVDRIIRNAPAGWEKKKQPDPAPEPAPTPEPPEKSVLIPLSFWQKLVWTFTGRLPGHIPRAQLKKRKSRR